MKEPKGKLIAVGGNEDKGTSPNTRKRFSLDFFELGILKHIMKATNNPLPQIEVVTSASMIPEEVGERYISAFGILGCKNVNLMHIREPEEAHDPQYLERIRQADVVMFSGGDQSRLSHIYCDTEFLQILKDRYQQEENFVLAGTSAGAMAMSDVMIKGGSVAEALMKGAVKIGRGFGLIHNVVIDSHFVKRGRFGRLIEAVAAYPHLIGIGLGEDTGVLITRGHFIETIGSNLVIIMDGHEINYNNTAESEKGRALSIEHIVMHVLAKSNVYDISKRRFYPNAEVYRNKLVVKEEEES